MTVIVTGAAGAIGSACVDVFLAAGHRVLAQDLRTDAIGPRDNLTVVTGNLTEPADLERLSRAVDGPLDAVVAAHGVAGSAALENCTPEFVNRVLTVNWRTVPSLFKAVERQLSASYGIFVSVASQAALSGESENAAYCAAKFGVRAWSETQALVRADIAFRCICPGATESPLLIAAQRQFAEAEGVTQEEYYKARTRQISLGRYGKPSEIAASILYLSARGTRPRVLAVTGGDGLL